MLDLRVIEQFEKYKLKFEIFEMIRWWTDLAEKARDIFIPEKFPGRSISKAVILTAKSLYSESQGFLNAVWKEQLENYS